MSTLATIIAASSFFALTGCGVEPGTKGAGPSPSQSVTTAGATVSASSLRVEQAIRQLESGRDLTTARTSLESVIKDPASTADERDDASFALSRSLDALGEKEEAIKNLEALIAKHGDEHPWRLEKEADDLLQKLVLGKAPAPRTYEEPDSPVVPLARFLTKYFPLRDGRGSIRLIAFGNGKFDGQGVWDIASAMRAERREACSLCDDSMSVHTRRSHESGWTRIPAERAHLGDALVVYYFDLGDGRIPARYDAYLPLPSNEIVAHLEKGEGLIAVRERPGAPPIVLIAAPRAAQLGDVEEALGAMKSLPTEPKTIAVSPRLRPEEIKSVLRSARKDEKACADALLARDPAASGKLTLKLEVKADGTVSEPTLESPSTTGLADATFQKCMLDAIRPLRFPAAGTSVKVSFPLVISK